MGGETINVVTKPSGSAEFSDIEAGLSKAEIVIPMSEGAKEALNIAIEHFNQQFKGKEVLGELKTYKTQVVAGMKYTFEFVNAETNKKHSIQVIMKLWLEKNDPRRSEVQID